MKMEKTSREILVTLSPADQEAFGVRYDTMSFSDFRTRRFCEHLAVLVCLREGGRETGNVTVRAVENVSGELLLYFSFPPELRSFSGSRVFWFSDLDGLLDSRRIFSPDPALVAEVYRYRNSYYLWIEYDADPVRFDRFVSRLSEYGVSVSVDRSVLSEHGEPLPGIVSLLLN